MNKNHEMWHWWLMARLACSRFSSEVRQIWVAVGLSRKDRFSTIEFFRLVQNPRRGCRDQRFTTRTDDFTSHTSSHFENWWLSFWLPIIIDSCLETNCKIWSKNEVNYDKETAFSNSFISWSRPWASKRHFEWCVSRIKRLLGRQFLRQRPQNGC